MLASTRGSKNLSAGPLSQLNRHGANSTCATVNQNFLAFAQTGQHVEIRPDGAGHFWKRRGCHQIYAFRYRHELACGHCHVFGVSPASHHCTDEIVDLPTSDLAAHLSDPPRTFKSENFTGTLGWWV